MGIACVPRSGEWAEDPILDQLCANQPLPTAFFKALSFGSSATFASLRRGFNPKEFVESNGMCQSEQADG